MRKNLRTEWLVRLRWIIVVAEVGLLAGAALLPQLDVAFVPLAAVLALEAASNAALHTYCRRAETIPDVLVPTVLALDIGLLTLGLWLSGGPMNPFSFLYVVYVAVAAVLAGGFSRWVLLGLAVGGYGLLYVLSPATQHGDAMMLHLQGMWVAMAVTAGLIIYFVSMLQRALSERERELAAVRANQQRVASLTTMAAGAAHELATPLSTIAVTSKELEHQLRKRDDALSDDASIIRSQVARCRDVLDRMAADAGQGRGESLQMVAVEDVVDRALATVDAPDSVTATIQCRGARIDAPPDSFAEAIASVLQNALDASEDDDTVTLSVDADDAVRFVIEDHGTGMTDDQIRQATDPFFTTKESPARMGLGLYVVHQLVLELGGAIELDSEPGEGSRVTIQLPTSTTARDARANAGETGDD
jgi:two-component system sensor histidine kinase RegB